MLIREIVHTCSNAHVARAAIASIGGDFASSFAERAERKHLPAGVLAASLVRDFSANADDEAWQSIDAMTRGADQPILAGLRAILARGLSACDAKPPVWMIDDRRACA